MSTSALFHSFVYKMFPHDIYHSSILSVSQLTDNIEEWCVNECGGDRRAYEGGESNADVLTTTVGVYYGIKGICSLAESAAVWRNARSIAETIEGEGETNPLVNVQYTEKVIAQMEIEDYHGFPESVDAFGQNGNISTIVGEDTISRGKIEIPGGYRDEEGVFQYIIEPDGITCNHRLFVPNK